MLIQVNKKIAKFVKRGEGKVIIRAHLNHECIIRISKPLQRLESYYDHLLFKAILNNSSKTVI